jgi:hypothetical protein
MLTHALYSVYDWYFNWAGLLMFPQQAELFMSQGKCTHFVFYLIIVILQWTFQFFTSILIIRSPLPSTSREAAEDADG